MINELLNNQVYASLSLRDYIVELEKKYNVVSTNEKFKKLVNFSTNVSVPYHQWFLYREGFSYELIESLIQMSSLNKEEIIIDPFCGSGTTNVVSQREGHPTLGLDVNPMSSFISNAKLQLYSKSDLDYVLHFAKQKFVTDQNPTICESIKQYFQPELFKELLTLKKEIEKEQDSKRKQLLKVALISITLDCSERKRDGNGLKKRTTKVKSAYRKFEEKIQQIVNDILIKQTKSAPKGVCLWGNALELQSSLNTSFKTTEAGAVIFSPPYPNSFDYFESYKLELVMGGFVSSIQDIKALRKKAVRSFVGAKKQAKCDDIVDKIAQEIESRIPAKEEKTSKKDTRTRKVPDMIRGYFLDMNKVLKQCYLSLRQNGKTFIVVDESSYCGVIVPTDLILASMGEKIGFKVNQIIICRKARTSTQQLKEYPYLKTALRESIIELEKI